VPNTFLQAGKYSIPVLSMNVDPEKMITEFNGGILSGENVNILSEKCEELFLDDQKRTDFGKNLRSYVEEQHDVNAVTQKLMDYIYTLKNNSI